METKRRQRRHKRYPAIPPRRQRLDHAFLSARLKEARSYTRIAGYFRSPIQCECFAAISAQTRFQSHVTTSTSTGEE